MTTYPAASAVKADLTALADAYARQASDLHLATLRLERATAEVHACHRLLGAVRDMAETHAIMTPRQVLGLLDGGVTLPQVTP